MVEKIKSTLSIPANNYNSSPAAVALPYGVYEKINAIDNRTTRLEEKVSTIKDTLDAITNEVSVIQQELKSNAIEMEKIAKGQTDLESNFIFLRKTAITISVGIIGSIVVPIVIHFL